MKKILFLALLSMCAYATSYATDSNSTSQEIVDATQNVEYIKTVTLYRNVGGSLKESSSADLFKQPWGYGYRYFIQIQNTSIQMLVNPRNYNTPQGFNSWSVDGWGYYYYYNI